MHNHEHTENEVDARLSLKLNSAVANIAESHRGSADKAGNREIVFRVSEFQNLGKNPTLPER